MSPFAGFSGRLIKGSNMKKKGYSRVPGTCVFLRIPLISFCTQRMFWFKHRMWPVAALHTLACSVIGEPCWTWMTFESCWTHACHWPPRNLYSWGFRSATGRQGKAATHFTRVSPVEGHATLSHQTALTKCKHKNKMISYKGDSRALKQEWTLLNTQPCENA